MVFRIMSSNEERYFDQNLLIVITKKQSPTKSMTLNYRGLWRSLSRTGEVMGVSENDGYFNNLASQACCYWICFNEVF